MIISSRIYSVPFKSLSHFECKLNKSIVHFIPTHTPVSPAAIYVSYSMAVLLPIAIPLYAIECSRKFALSLIPVGELHRQEISPYLTGNGEQKVRTQSKHDFHISFHFHADATPFTELIKSVAAHA